ncbi:MAG TPA: DNA cytosine methyltransferase [Kofleriaceae bacterium]|nr:DNA cytosine methyltransferase [Kofleriaceae bacterium]
MSRPTVLSLYSGAGGLDYGFEAAGFRTRAAIEMDGPCCQTLRANRPRWAIVEDDIHKVPTAAMLEAAHVGRGDIDVVIGGPPCQPFSKSGYWARGDTLRLGDPRARTLEAYLRVVEQAQPRAFVLENVAGLAFDGKSEGLRFLLQGIHRINRCTGSAYRPFHRIVRAADFGVPQIRERFFLIAARDGADFAFPEATHATASDRLPANLEPHRTAWDAIGDLLPEADSDLAPRGKWAALLPTIPEGHNYLWHTDRGGGSPLFGWRRRYWSFLLKLAKNRPSWTIQAQPGPAIGPFHWHNRRLSGRELCRLQTFPDDVTVLGGIAAVHKQLGNAVPSLLGEVLARAIASQLLGCRPPDGRLRLLPPRRNPVPPPEPTTAVPSAYRRYIGSHSPHPGTGRGHGAVIKRLERLQKEDRTDGDEGAVNRGGETLGIQTAIDRSAEDNG